MGRNELSQRVRLISYVIAIENQLLSTAKRTSKNPPHLPIPFSIDLLSRFCRRKVNGYGGLIEGGRLIFPVLHPMAIWADPGAYTNHFLFLVGECVVSRLFLVGECVVSREKRFCQLLLDQCAKRFICVISTNLFTAFFAVIVGILPVCRHQKAGKTQGVRRIYQSESDHLT